MQTEATKSTETSHAVPATRERSTAAARRRPRSLAQYLGVTARGFCMGAADVVPGVSGGTMAFILGIYEELIDSIRMAARPPFWRALTRFDLREAIYHVNLFFLVFLGVGVVSAIVALAPGIEYLLVNQPILIWSFFFGLIVASVFIVAQRVAQWSIPLVGAVAIGAVIAYTIVGLVPVQTPEVWWFLALSGAISICAMILPGISGSFILVLLGKYQFFVSAVNQRDFIPIFWLLVGATIGLVTFAQVLGWLFRSYRNATIAVLTGFMIGSLRKVWPWKEVLETMTDRHGDLIPIVERNILPPFTVNGGSNAEIGLALAMAAIGLGAVILLERLASRAGEPLH